MNCFSENVNFFGLIVLNSYSFLEKKGGFSGGGLEKSNKNDFTVAESSEKESVSGISMRMMKSPVFGIDTTSHFASKICPKKSNQSKIS